MNNIGIYNETKTNLEELAGLKDLLEFALEYQKIGNVDFNIILVSEEKIHEINKEYRHIDRPTDVISFALEDTKDIEYQGYRLLGDIYICDKKVFEQADIYGHSVKRELSFLALHGLLHLLGYDHMETEEEKIMFNLQDEILEKYGITR